MPETKIKKSVWKRWYMIVFYVFVGLMIIGTLLPDSNNSNSSNTNTQNSNFPNQEIPNQVEDLEQVYVNEFLTINSKATKTTQNIVSTSEKASNFEISFSQAAELYRIYEFQFQGYLDELNSMNVPSKYSAVHNRYKNGISLFTEAMDLAATGAETINADLILQATEKIQEGTTEITTATEIMKTLS